MWLLKHYTGEGSIKVGLGSLRFGASRLKASVLLQAFRNCRAEYGRKQPPFTGRIFGALKTARGLS